MRLLSLTTVFQCHRPHLSMCLKEELSILTILFNEDFIGFWCRKCYVGCYNHHSFSHRHFDTWCPYFTHHFHLRSSQFPKYIPMAHPSSCSHTHVCWTGTGNHYTITLWTNHNLCSLSWLEWQNSITFKVGFLLGILKLFFYHK